MSVVKKINPEDFPRTKMRPRRLTVEMAAIRNLKHGEAIKFPCRWKHSRSKSGQTVCSGSSSAYQTARRARNEGIIAFHVTVKCQRKVLYVMRRDKTESYSDILRAVLA